MVCTCRPVQFSPGTQRSDKQVKICCCRRIGKPLRFSTVQPLFHPSAYITHCFRCIGTRKYSSSTLPTIILLAFRFQYSPFSALSFPPPPANFAFVTFNYISIICSLASNSLWFSLWIGYKNGCGTWRGREGRKHPPVQTLKPLKGDKPKGFTCSFPWECSSTENMRRPIFTHRVSPTAADLPPQCPRFMPRQVTRGGRFLGQRNVCFGSSPGIPNSIQACFHLGQNNNTLQPASQQAMKGLFY